MNRRLLRLAVLAALALPLVSNGARRPFVVGHDGSMLADGDVEIENWVDLELNPKVDPTATPRSFSTGWLWWVGFYWSPHDDVELRAFTSVIQRDDLDATKPSGASVWAELLSARWRFLTGDLGSLTAQLDLRIPILQVLLWQVQPSLSWSKKLDRFTFNAQAGYAAGFRSNANIEKNRYHWLTWDAGVAVDVVKGEVAPVLQLGVEAFSEVVFSGFNDLTNTRDTTLNVGPTISVARGRLWFTAGVLFGATPSSPNIFLRAMAGLAL